MPRFTVYHYIGTVDRFSESAYRTFWPGPMFSKVADVEAPGLDAVFELTNHIDRPWPSNPGVTPIAPNLLARSTSVGDVITTTDVLGYERAFGVAGTGFEDITRVTLTPEDWGLKASPLESSPDAAAEWAVDARMAEAADGPVKLTPFYRDEG